MANFFPIKVSDITRETSDAVSIQFDIPRELRPRFDYESGQYVNIKLKMNGSEEIRSYSLSSSPAADDEWRIAVKVLEGGKVSGYLNSELRVGDELQLSQPEGKFTIPQTDDEAREHVFFAAGSGITPVRSMIKTVLEKEPGSRCVLFFGNRNEDSIIFKDEIAGLASKHTDRFKVYHVFSRPEDEATTKEQYGPHSVGRIDRQKAVDLVREYAALESEPIFYLCGPNGMMQSVENALETVRVGSDRIVKEYFSTPDEPESENSDTGETKPVTCEAHIILDDEEFDITVDAGTTVLDAALENDIDAPYSCRGGVCSTCMAKLEEGKAEMRLNYVLTNEEVEEGYILTCQAVPVTPTLRVNYDE